jgi:hypothetical protein
MKYLMHRPLHKPLTTLVCNFNATSGEITLSDHVSTGNLGILSLTNTRLYLDAYDFYLNNLGAV